MTRHTMPLVLLAAGASRRMGDRDKLLEDVDGMPLLRHQALKARAFTDGPILVALPPRPHPRYGALDGLDLTLLPVPEAAEGMNASLRTAIAALPADAPCAMVLLGDLPDLESQDLVSVANAVDLGSDIQIWRGCTETGKPGHPIVFHRRLFAALRALTGDDGGRDVVRAAGNRVQHVPLPGERARADLDTPEAWAAWRARRGT